MTSPVVQKLWYMYDMLCPVSKTQYHIVVLTSVKLGPEQLCSVKKRPLKNTEMADIVIGTQVVYGIIRFEVHGDHPVDVIPLKGGLITVDIVRILLIYCLYIPVQNLRMKNIIVVKKTYVLSVCKLQAVVGIACDTFVLLKLLIDDPAG